MQFKIIPLLVTIKLMDRIKDLGMQVGMGVVMLRMIILAVVEVGVG